MLKIFHFDMNFVCLRPEYIRKWLKKIGAMGYNALLWELENKVRWDTCPECVWPEAMSKEQFKKILAFSRELGLEPIPLLQTIGHGEYVLQHEKYSTFRENPERHDCYCSSNSEVRSFLRNWIEEYLDLFGELHYFHLGGDEAYEFATCPVCKAYAKDKGHNQLYFDHISSVAAPLLHKGVRPGIWGDMILQHPKAIEVISKDFILWDWNYTGSDLGSEDVPIRGVGYVARKTLTDEIRQAFPEIENPDGSLNSFYTCAFLKSFGYDVISCSASRSGGDSNYCGRHKIHSENIVGSARKTVQYGLFGNCVTSWAIRQHSFEVQEQWLPLAPFTIDHPDLTYEQIIKEVGRIFFEIEPIPFYNAIEKIGTPYLFNISQQVGIQWNRLKDSTPAPDGYLHDYIEKLRANDDLYEAYWKSRHFRLETAKQQICDGITELNHFSNRANCRLDLLGYWKFVGNFQLLHLTISQAIVSVADDKKINRDDVLEVINLLRTLFKAYTEITQTTESATHNTGLMYNSITKYLSVPSS